MTKEEAIALYETQWWEKVPLEEAAMMQLFEDWVIMPFGDFHHGIQKLLGRPVWTHEFASADQPGGLREQATGKARKPTFREILELIPPEKRILVGVPSCRPREE